MRREQAVTIQRFRRRVGTVLVIPTDCGVVIVSQTLSLGDDERIGFIAGRYIHEPSNIRIPFVLNEQSCL